MPRCRLLVGFLLTSCALSWTLLALDPQKAISQYTHTLWTQEQGLPQDTIRAIAQTTDGYLWLGTNEGLARFDGYDFVTFTKDGGALPESAVTTLYAGRDDTLWIGTFDSLVRYSNGKFTEFGVEDGLPPGDVNAVTEDGAGVVWVVSGGLLSRLQDGRFFSYPKEELAPLESARVVYEDAEHNLWVGGVNGVVKRTERRFVTVAGPRDLRGDIITTILRDRTGVWMGGAKGIVVKHDDGSFEHIGVLEGLSDERILAMCRDHSGSLWVGTTSGLSRLYHGRVTNPAEEADDDRDRVWSLLEDREGNLWVGLNSALERLRDDRFTVFGRSEGLPSDKPIVVHQDRFGELWVGYSDGRLVAFRNGEFRTYSTLDGLPNGEIFSLRDAANGDLLIGTMAGLSRMHNGHFANYHVPDPVGRNSVFDAIEDDRGCLWAATASGVYRYCDGKWGAIDSGGSSPAAYSVALLQAQDRSIWAGALTNGLWHITNPSSAHPSLRSFTAAAGLGTNQIRALYQDKDGTLWIGTFGGGLAMLRKGVFRRFTFRDGLLSDNISHIEDDQRGNLWLSTTRGICKVPRKQLEDFCKGKIHNLTPENFGIADGLRSLQCAPGFPIGGGGTRTRDGHLWFPTGLGLATIDPGKLTRVQEGSQTHTTRIVSIDIDGKAIDRTQILRLKPETGLVQFRYVGIYLSAPERVRYSYKLEGLDHRWTQAGSRRVVNYNHLPPGRYQLYIRATFPQEGIGESQFRFEVLPHFYETAWFIALCGVIIIGTVYGAYRLRVRRIHSRFALVFEERARLAREIHDTLAQGFVGISGQLDALEVKLDRDLSSARQHLHLAQKMARHSLTEARRSVLDLRTSELEGQSLSAALVSLTRQWAAGSATRVQVRASDVNQSLPGQIEQNILRIAQEAVVNAVKHSRAHTIWVGLEIKDHVLHLNVKDDGEGFQPCDGFPAKIGHFGIVGMKERAERLGGTFSLASHPGSGTRVEVVVPIAR